MGNTKDESDVMKFKTGHVLELFGSQNNFLCLCYRAGTIRGNDFGSRATPPGNVTVEIGHG